MIASVVSRTTAQALDKTHSQEPTASGVMIAVRKVDGNSSSVSTFLSSNLTLLPCQCAV